MEDSSECGKKDDRYRTIFENVPAGISMLDRDFRILEVNRKIREWYPDLRPEQRPRCFESYNNPPRKDVCPWCPSAKVFADGKTHQSITSTPHRDGTKNYRITVSPLFDEQGTITSVIELVEDLTDQMRAEESLMTQREAADKKRRLLEDQLAHSQKLETIGTLAGGIAHDFNNILQPILGYVEMALEDSEGQETIQSSLREVMRAAGRARDLVKQILTFSRQVPTEKAPLAMHLVVKEAARLLRSSIPSTIEIRQRIHTDCAPVLADATQLHQVVMNLCTNAYQAMESGTGVLEISLDDCEVDAALCARSLELKPGPYVRLTVEDSGSGMDPSTMARIFEPFFTTKPFGKGTGLGLPMVHGIVAAHGGAVLVESSPGSGTTFEVYFPALQKNACSASPDSSGVQEAPIGIRALYVDDEVPILHMIRRTLEKRGVETRALASPHEALEVFRQDPRRFDVVITDLMMPKMTGAGFAARIHELRPDIPVILVTGFSETLDREVSGPGPFASVLHKPVGVSELLEAIMAAVGAEGVSTDPGTSD